MKNTCKHINSQILNPMPKDLYYIWHWCPDCGATKLSSTIINVKFDSRWKSPKNLLKGNK